MPHDSAGPGPPLSIHQGRSELRFIRVLVAHQDGLCVLPSPELTQDLQGLVHQV